MLPAGVFVRGEHLSKQPLRRRKARFCMQRAVSQKRWVDVLLLVEHVLCEVIDRVCSVVLLAMLASMVWQVICRFVLKLSVPWTDELARYLFITLAYIGAGAAISENTHVEISLINSLLKKIKNERTKRMLSKIDDIARCAILLVLAIILLKLAWPYMWQVKAIAQYSPAMHLPTWILDGALVFGLISMAFHALLRILISIGDHDAIIDPMVLEKEDAK
jgi:TRAP-type C4-dicarboxylate transport system permease small subunit